jgi:hypothetical protein
MPTGGDDAAILVMRFGLLRQRRSPPRALIQRCLVAFRVPAILFSLLAFRSKLDVGARRRACSGTQYADELHVCLVDRPAAEARAGAEGPHTVA